MSASNRTHKKTKKNKKIETNETHAIKWNRWLRASSHTYHEVKSFIIFICNRNRVHETFLKSKLQIMKLKTWTSILGLKNYFLTYSALQTLVLPNLCLLLRLSQILNIFNVSFSSGLNRLNTFSPYQKFVQIGNAQNLGSGFIWQSCLVEINTAPQHNW